MSSPTAVSGYGVAVGTAPNIGMVPFVTSVNPGTNNIQGPNGPFQIGQRWVNSASNETFTLSSFAPKAGVITANWTQEGGAGSGTVTSVTGTSNQVDSSPTTGAVVVSLPANVVAPGSLSTITTLASGTTLTGGTGIVATMGNIVATTGNISSTVGSVSAATTVTAGTGVTATTGPITASNGNLVLGTAGNKILSTSVGTTTSAGANSFGSVTLSGGTATVATSAVTASSLIYLSRQSVGSTGAAALGILSVGTITASTSFVINAWLTANATSLATTDVSVISWMIVN